MKIEPRVPRRNCQDRIVVRWQLQPQQQASERAIEFMTWIILAPDSMVPKGLLKSTTWAWFKIVSLPTPDTETEAPVDSARARAGALEVDCRGCNRLEV